MQSFKELAAKHKKDPKGMRELLQEWQFSPDREKSQKYVKHEYQDYGVRLSYKLNDRKHTSLYIGLAKKEKRELLEKAYSFAVDYPNMEGKNRGRLFMWALGKLRKGGKLYEKNNQK
ncbi:MAG: hypothetical protein PHS44_01105 [Candidatus Dojkabacteria bacterium]|jgi:hypothetical protein|nr:hypothetical protein [Candidatus Dojkabacteria bacterium]